MAELVGREKELARLRELAGEAARGAGRLLFVTGDAGSGNSTGTLLCIRDGCGALVRVHRGTVVLTHERDAEDHVIRSGETFVVQRGGKTVVTTAAEAALVLDDPVAGRIELKEYVGGRPVFLSIGR